MPVSAVELNVLNVESALHKRVIGYADRKYLTIFKNIKMMLKTIKVIKSCQ